MASTLPGETIGVAAGEAKEVLGGGAVCCVDAGVCERAGRRALAPASGLIATAGV